MYLAAYILAETRQTDKDGDIRECESLTADAVSFVVSVVTEAGERTTCSVDVSTYVTGRTA